MKKFNIKTIWQYFAPQHALTAFGGWLASSEIPWLKNYLIRYFLNRYDVDLSETISSDINDYKSFNEFFTRALRPEVRPLHRESNSIISPVDGTISQMGLIQSGKIFQAKNHYFSLLELVGGDERLANIFQKGFFSTIYLAPHNYHRVHCPLDATLTQTIYIPGKLFSVNPITAETIPNLFARNERLVCAFKTAYGNMLVIFVGAMVVGKITTVWQNIFAKRITSQNFDLPFKAGDLLGQFSLGSTVLVLLDHQVDWQKTNPIKMGQLIAKIPAQSPSSSSDKCKSFVADHY